MKKRKAKKTKAKLTSLINSEGRRMFLRSNLTIEELVKMGFSGFGLVDPVKPHVDPAEYRSERY